MSEVKTLARGLRILEILGASQDSVGVTELAKEIGVDKSSVSRLVQTLVKYRFAERDSKTRRYRLGSKIRDLSQQMERHTQLSEQVKPFLHELVDKTGENAHLAIYAENCALVIADVESPATLRVVSGVGRVIPLHCTAVGKSLLAFHNIPVPEQLPQLTSDTITDHNELMRHLEQVRHAGIAVDDEEHILGVCCLAAPIYDYSAQAIASIGISGPTVRVTPHHLPQLITIVTNVATALSTSLGYQEP
ncbi:MAG: IclR family transcriptional regulator [Ardenticatenaceae bacterium]